LLPNDTVHGNGLLGLIVRSQAFGSQDLAATSKALRRIWSHQKARFLVVGGCNTISGYLVSTLLYYLLHAVMVLLGIVAISTIINVTVSFLTNKLLVFRSQGNFLPEYLRFYFVSLAPIALNFVLLPVGIDMLGMNPYLAIAAVTGLTVAISYFGHRHITFRPEACR